MTRPPFHYWKVGVYCIFMSGDDMGEEVGFVRDGMQPTEEVLAALTLSRKEAQGWVNAVNNDEGIAGVRAKLICFELHEVEV